jgi:UDP-N-acetylmuramyl pentapeptide phosphotransferase/UDP-N-acetylglucosamine-1-phosphate transferase
MFEVYVIFFTLFSTVVINYFLIKKKLLLDKKYSPHKSFINNDTVPLSGGIIFLLSICIFYPSEFYPFKLTLCAIFLIGIFSDLNIISSPVKRIIIQTLIILVFLYIDQTYIQSIRWLLIDHYLKSTIFGYLFSLVCLVVLINGTNFMDGVNTLVIGYFLIVTLAIFYIATNFNLELNLILIKVILITLSVIFLFNFFGKLFLGDGGSYLIAFVLGYFLINFSNTNDEVVSPYFAACMLWYPAYENLFSIIRKMIKKNSPTEADNRHLHQLLFVFMTKNFSYSNKVLNTISGLIINFFNIAFFTYAMWNFDNTKNLILLIIVSIFFYNLFYYYFSKKINL